MLRLVAACIHTWREKCDISPLISLRLQGVSSRGPITQHVPLFFSLKWNINPYSLRVLQPPCVMYPLEYIVSGKWDSIQLHPLHDKIKQDSFLSPWSIYVPVVVFCHKRGEVHLWKQLSLSNILHKLTLWQNHNRICGNFTWLLWKKSRTFL